MLKLSALALLGAMTVTTAAQIHAPGDVAPTNLPPAAAPLSPAVNEAGGAETLAVYFSPLDSTEVARWVGLDKAYHMALVYTDRDGVSHGASSGPSNLVAAQTPTHALTAVLASFDDAPSVFGTLVADPADGKPFVEGSRADYFTKDAAGHGYPHATVLRGRDLSARWASILATYARVGAMKLTYSPVTQNSNSLAVTALHRAGVPFAYSSDTLFVPGAFTTLP